MLDFKASVLVFGFFAILAFANCEHEKFWSEPQFFASLTDYLTGGVKGQSQGQIQKGIASELVPRYVRPQLHDSVASASNAHGQQRQWKDFDYAQARRPSPHVLIARPLPQSDSFASQEVLAFTVTSSERPRALIAMPQHVVSEMSQPHPIFTVHAQPSAFSAEMTNQYLSQSFPHPNGLPTQPQKKRRRPRPNGRKRTTTTTTTPTPTTTTTVPPTTTDSTAYGDGDYGYDDYDDDYSGAQTTPTAHLATAGSATAPTFSSYQPHPQIIVPQYPQILSQGSNSVEVVRPHPQIVTNAPIAQAQTQSAGFSAQLAEAAKNPFAYGDESENDVDGTKPGLVNRINDMLETTRKVLYFPRGVVDVVDHAMSYAEQNPYVNLVMGTVADKIFGSTGQSSTFVTQKPKSLGITQLLIAKPTPRAAFTPTLATVPSLTQLIAQIFPSQPKA